MHPVFHTILCKWLRHLPFLCYAIPYHTIPYHIIPCHTIQYHFITYHASGFITYLPLWCLCNSKSSICIAASFPEEPLANQTKAVAFKMIKRIMTLTRDAICFVKLLFCYFKKELSISSCAK